MAWAIDSGDWGKATGHARQELRKVIATISRFEKVRLLTPRNLVGDAKSQHFGPNVEIVQAPVDDIWMRDIVLVMVLGLFGSNQVGAICRRSSLPTTLNLWVHALDERPRETLQFETPAGRFNACVASTG